MNLKGLVWCGALGAAACGSGDKKPDASVDVACEQMGGSACFQLPTAPMSTRDGAPSSLGCGPYAVKTSTTAVTGTGTVNVFGQSATIANASLKIFTSQDFTTTPVAVATSAADGTYSITFPAGTPNLLFGQYTAPNFLETDPQYFHANLAMDFSGFRINLLTSSVVESAAVLVKEVWDPSMMVIAGSAIDCQGLVIQHAAIVASATSGQRDFIPGVSLYYAAPGAVPLAVPPDQGSETSDNGSYAIFHLTPGAPVYIQLWGFTDAAAQAQGAAGLTLIAEEPIQVAANTAQQVPLWAK